MDLQSGKPAQSFDVVVVGSGASRGWACKDLEPYYDLVEEYVGITGVPEGVYELPRSPSWLSAFAPPAT